MEAAASMARPRRKHASATAPEPRCRGRSATSAASNGMPHADGNGSRSRRSPARGALRAAPPPPPSPPSPPSPPVWLSCFCALFVSVHLLLPMRRLLYDPFGDATWSQEGYIGSWLMKRHQTDGVVALVLEHVAASAGAPPSASATRGTARGVNASSRLVLLPQLDPWLTRHQRRFVAVRPTALRQYVAHRANALKRATAASGFADADADGSVRWRALSCFTHNARAPQPLYDAHVDLLGPLPATTSSCLSLHSAVGEWLVPLRPLSIWPSVSAPEQPAPAPLPTECAELLRAPLDWLRAAEAGFARLEGRDAPRDLDAEAVAWYWHALSLVHEAHDEALSG